MQNKTIISPSILSCDFSILKDEIIAIAETKAEMAHIDVMDGHFVPNITLGPDIVKSIRNKSKIFFDVHLMISKPFDYVESFVNAGADLITFHVESENDPMAVIQKIRKSGVMVGISLKPNTKIDTIIPFLPFVDLVLIMTVEPGFGGQKFMVEMMPKVRMLREEIDKLNKKIYLEVDGGINKDTAKTAVLNGADVLVAGSYIFGSDEYSKAVDSLIY